MKGIGITTNCRAGESFVEVLRNIKEAGFDSVMVDENCAMELEQGITLAQEQDLRVPYVHLQSWKANDLWTEGEQNRLFVKDMINRIEICARHSVPVAVLHPANTSRPNDPVPEPSGAGLESMHEILRHAEKHNVRIALENIDSSKLKNLFYLLDNVDSPYLGFCYDCGHNMLFTPEIDLMGKYGNRCIAIHIHDNNMSECIDGWHNDEHLIPGDGKIDFDRVARQIAKSPYNGDLMLESVQSPNCPKMNYLNMTSKEFLKKAHERGTLLTEKTHRFRNIDGGGPDNPILSVK